MTSRAILAALLSFGNQPATPERTIVAKGTVLPVSLTTDLSSVVSKVGDKFTAKLLTAGTKPYAGLPFGTVVYGTVKYVKRLEGNSAGLLELNFEGIETPSGNRFPIAGLLASMESKAIRRDKDGVLHLGEAGGGSASREDATRPPIVRSLFAGYGKLSRLVVAVNSPHPIKDADLSRLVAHELGKDMTSGFSDDVQLLPDTEFGVRLLAPLSVPKGVM